MAGQSITFDFLSRGSATVAGDFRKVGDNAALASRGAKILGDVIGKLGDKEDRTAAESVLLAKALRQTGEAADRTTARMVLADAAVRRLDDDMKAAAKKPLVPQVLTGKALAKFAEIQAKADELRAKFPQLTVQINDKVAKAELDLFAADTKAKLGDLEVKVKVDESALTRARKALGGLSGPGLVGPALLLAPAAATLGGVGAGAGAGLAGAFVAGGLALAAFGAIAKPVLTDAKTAAGAVEKAQNAYNIAIANGVPPAKAFKAEQVAIAKAYAGMSPAQVALSKQIGAMGDAWDKVKTAQTPVIAGALQPWLRSITDLTGKLGPIIAKIAPVIQGLGTQFGALVNSSAFTQFRDFIGSTGSAAVSAGGSTIIDLVKSFMILLPKFDPLIREAVGWISRLGPAVLTWASSKKASDDITKFLQWFSQNGPAVGRFLQSVGAALAALAPGLTSGGALELKAVTAFLNFVAKLPPGLAKPLAEVAGAMLILQKTGVVSVGIKLVGLGAAASGAGAAGGPFAAAGAAIAGGILLGIRRSLAAGWKTAVAELPKLLEGVGSILNFSAQGWANAILDHFAKPIRKMWADLGHFLTSSFDVTRHQVASAWDAMTNVLAKAFDIFENVVGIKWDDIKLTFFHGVQYILNIMGKLPGPLGAPFRTAARDIGNSMAGVQADIARRTGQIQKDINAIHGKTVKVNFVGSGSGSIAFKESIPGVTTGPSSAGILGFHAVGGLIRMGTGPTSDDVPAMLSRGELVVPANMVSSGAVDHLRGRLPGFAGGGAVTGLGPSGLFANGAPFMANTEAAFGKAVEGAFAAAAIAKFKKDAAAALVKASQPFGPLGDSGARSGSAALAQAFARSIMGQYHWGPEQWPPWLYLGNQESGWSAYAVNKQSGAYGIGQSLGHGHPYNLGDYKTQVIWMANYIRGRYGNPANAWAHERANNWYGEGGLVPGYASGGSVARQGQTFLNAWRSRHGGPYALAIGPKVLNEQIPEMAAALGRARTLAGARGLSKGQHAFWAKTAASETRELATLYKERATEQAWRGQLQLSELGLDKEIRAAGNLPGLAGPVRGWKAQLAAHKYTVGQISRMLGTSNAQQAAAKAKAKPPAPTGVLAKHVYGGDVANNLGTVLAAALGPFTGAARGGLLMDSGGTLRPGWNAAYNGTGRPEHLVPARGGSGTIRLEVSSGGSSEFDQFMTGWLRKHVRVKGGGSVQHAFGAH